MSLPSLTFAQCVDRQVASWSASLGFQPTLQRGDSMYALMQTVASQIMFLQALAVMINLVARAQTSAGADLDSFYAQFGFTRLPGVAATGPEIFSTASPVGADVLIPAGTIVQTSGGAIRYQVVADTDEPTWNATRNGYVLAAGQSSLTATVQALVAGAASNVGPNVLTQIASLTTVDFATNAASISNGSDQESDASFRSRFVPFLNSLSKATESAIKSAIAGVQVNIENNLLENVNSAGQPGPGQFTAVIDDGSGDPPSSLILAVQQALEGVRGFTILANVRAVAKVDVTISVAIRVAPPSTIFSITPAVQQAVAAYVNSTEIGGIDGVLVYVSGVTAAAQAVPGVISVQPNLVLINGAPADLAGTPFQDAKTINSAVSVGLY